MSRPVSIGLVIGQLTHGGAERQLYELAKRMDRSRFEPIVISLSTEPEPYGRFTLPPPRPHQLYPSKRSPPNLARGAGLAQKGLEIEAGEAVGDTLIRLTGQGPGKNRLF